MNNLHILNVNQCESLDEFVRFWRKLYSYGNEQLYIRNIHNKEFDEGNLRELYHWKNGMTLSGSGGKEKSLNEKIIKRINHINSFKKDESIDLESFNSIFGDVSAVWRIFLLHIIKPDTYPIYDQHVHRAYNYLHGEDWKSINNNLSNKVKLDFYYNHYLPFVFSMKELKIKEVDEALFAFGQFLNNGNSPKLLIP